MDREQRLAPGEIFVMDGMRLVVENHEVFEGCNPFQHRAAFRQVLAVLRTQQCSKRVLWRPLLVARLVELVDVGEEELAGSIRLGAFASEDHLKVQLSPPRRNQWQLVENTVARKILFKPLVNDDIRRNYQEVGRKRRPRHTL